MYDQIRHGTFCFVVASTISMAVASGPVPIISEALSCGQQGQAGGLANGIELQRFDLDLSVFPDALCNDGSTAVFYFRPFSGPANRDRWLFQLQGGGGCGSGERCAQRWCMIDTAFSLVGMTSTVAPAVAINGKGITDRRPANPFGNWNHVFIKYCSSDSWRGVSRDVILQTDIEGPLVDYRIHFLGNRIIDAVLDTLRRDGVSASVYTQGPTPVPMPDLDNATHVILAGASAGGSGVIQNADRVGDYLHANNTACAGDECPLVFRVLIDSSFAPSLEDLDITTSTFCTDFKICDWQALLAFGTAAHDPNIDQSCFEWHQTNAPGTEWQCDDAGHVIRHHVTTPMFVRMGQKDSLVSSNFINTGYSVPGKGSLDLPLFMEIVRDECASLVNIQATAHEGATIPVLPGVFSPRCPKHETLRSSPDTYNAVINDGPTNLAMFNVFTNWINGSQPSVLITPDGGSDFCPGFLPADCNFDDLVDLDDFIGFQNCATGPAEVISPNCVCYDIDTSQTVDMIDFSALQQNFTGTP